MAHILETERLALRKFTLDDDAFMFRLLTSPGWLKFIGDRNIKTHDDAKKYIATGFFDSYDKFGFGPYVVQLKGTLEPVGMCCLIKRDALEDVDIGYALLDEFAGKGYAYEATVATLNYAIKDLGIKKIVAITDTDNVSSIKLIKKLGMHFEKMVLLPGEKEELFLFTN